MERILEIIGGMVAAVFTVFGIVILLDTDLEGKTRQIMQNIALAAFLIIFNGAAACMMFVPNVQISQYFGYLISWTGRALHFLLMGFFLYPSANCEVYYHGRRSKDLMDCFDHAKLLNKLIIISVFLSIFLGIFFLIARCFIVQGRYNTSSSSSQAYPCDPINLMAGIASGGIVLYAVLKLLYWLDAAEHLYLLQNCYEFSVIFFLMVAGLFSLLSCFSASSLVASYFGFLYHLTGRGLFYIFMGFYMFASTPYPEGSESAKLWICYICAIISIIVGIIYLVLRCQRGSGGGAVYHGGGGGYQSRGAPMQVGMVRQGYNPHPGGPGYTGGVTKTTTTTTTYRSP